MSSQIHCRVVEHDTSEYLRWTTAEGQFTGQATKGR